MTRQNGHVGESRVEFVGNYTAFADLRGRLVSAPRSVLTVVVVFPDLLGTYGDGGNGVVLARRAAWRGIDVELVEATSGRPVPSGDIYCLGGGEDGPQVRAAATLIEDGTLGRSVEDGAVVLSVCAGFQIAGRSFPDASGRPHDGLGLPRRNHPERHGRAGGRGAGGRSDRRCSDASRNLALPPLIGVREPRWRHVGGGRLVPLARVVHGMGNGDGNRCEGAWSKRVVGTYLHGPVLPRNPVLADLLLGWALGRTNHSSRLDDAEEQIVRAERTEAAAVGGRGGRLRRQVFAPR